MQYQPVTFDVLDHWLSRAPVLAAIHPLVPLCFETKTQIIENTNSLLMELDSYGEHGEERLLILATNSLLQGRFPKLSVLEHPPIQAINSNFHHHLAYARKHLLTNHKVAAHIADHAMRHHYEVVVVLLVDGLSYEDVNHWQGDISPCFIDSPSVTYRFSHLVPDQLLSNIGFASIIGRPSIYSRLYDLGYHHARGFTYWNPSDNVIADYMFEGIPYVRVTNFQAILTDLEEQIFPQNTYIQIVRQGLDGLAHGKRELHKIEVESAVQAIRQDIEHLRSVLRKKDLTCGIYVTSDHGVLWKTEHEWRRLDLPGSKPRFSTTLPSSTLSSYFVQMDVSEPSYFLLRYPYLAAPIRANDSGVHGGLSYQESIVPMMKFEVR